MTNKHKVTTIAGPIDVNKSYRIVEGIGFVSNKGDVTSDDDVNVVDVVQIVHEILFNYYNFQANEFWAADLDYSNEINVLDITKLVEFILNH